MTYAERIANGEYALYIKGNYVGTFPKVIVNIKLRALNAPGQVERSTL